jgi:hypothetical protein
VTKGDSLITPLKPLSDKDFNLKGDKGDSKNHFAIETTLPIEDHPVTTENLKGDLPTNDESPLSPLSPFDSETQSQQGFTKGDNLENSESPLVTLVTFSESPQDSDRPVGDTDNLKPDDYCFFKGRCHTVISVDGDKITVKDWYEKDNPSCLPFTVSIDEVVIDTPGPKREKKKKAK